MDVWLWVAFAVFVLAMLTLDLGVFQRKAHAVSFREAGLWSAVWIGLALAFGAGLFVLRGQEAGLQFLTGYLIEKALSVDNLFVFVLIFSAFAVPAAYQHRVLFWGILGALVMRGALIALGTALLTHFHAVIYLFGAFLILAGVRMLRGGEPAVTPDRNPVVRLARRLVPVAAGSHGPRFLVRHGGRLAVTPLLLALLVVETTDLIFALDSIPAILAVSTDPFIVYTSNVFAILGLRALYFLLAGAVDRFIYLRTGLAIVLAFVGLKMLTADLVPIPLAASLGVIALVLTTTITASLLRTAGRRPAAPPATRQPLPGEVQ